MFLAHNYTASWSAAPVVLWSFEALSSDEEDSLAPVTGDWPTHSSFLVILYWLMHLSVPSTRMKGSFHPLFSSGGNFAISVWLGTQFEASACLRHPQPLIGSVSFMKTRAEHATQTNFNRDGTLSCSSMGVLPIWSFWKSQLTFAFAMMGMLPRAWSPVASTIAGIQLDQLNLRFGIH